MPQLSQAPLIEAIFEIRWGSPQPAKGGMVNWNFDDEDTSFFVGQFHGVAKARGYSTVERPNPTGLSIPHVVTHRFRPKPNVWPCYQIGLGIATVNQINDGYEWGGI